MSYWQQGNTEINESKNRIGIDGRQVQRLRCPSCRTNRDSALYPLAWLLDPNESHGRGQLFLKAILSDVLRRMPHPRPIQPLDLVGIDLRGVDVQCEGEHIDVLINSGQPALVIAIENKIDSAEHGDQISDKRCHRFTLS